MKVLIVTSLSGGWPYIPEMLEEFSKVDVTSYVFDIDILESSESGKSLGPLPMLFLKIPKLRYFIKILLLWKRLQKEISSYDVINIHYALQMYKYLIKSFRKRCKLLVTSLWGSDFLRANTSDLRALSCVLRLSDIITSNNPAVLRKLSNHYSSFTERSEVVRFGLKSIDKIRELQLSEGRYGSKVNLGLPLDKTIITCGYNAIRQQQHGLMIEALASLPMNMRNSIFVIFQMTYPDNPKYKEEIRKKLEATGIVNYLIIDKMQLFEDVCRLRLASDIAINIQMTDSLSASIQEHIYSGSYLIVGNWLPYQVFESMGVPLHKVNNSIDITKEIENYLMVQRKNDNMTNACTDAIYNFSSWSTNILLWKDLYQRGHEKRSRLIGGLAYE
jgi:hypothetical protein